MGKLSQSLYSCLALKRLTCFFIVMISILGCTRAKQDTSQVTFSLPQTGQAYSNKISQAPSTLTTATTWTVSDPSVFEDISCYAVFVTAPDLNKGKCVDSSNTEVFQVGLIAGLYPAGSQVTLDVPTGSKRTIRLVGLKATHQSFCTLANLKNLPFNDLSSPFILGSTLVDLVPGANSVSITANLDTSKKFYSCSGDTVVAFGPTSITTTPSTVIATVAGTPPALSNFINFNVTVGGSGVVSYKYKLGAANGTDCANAAGYGAETAVANSITTGLSGFSDGNLKLCVVGADAAGVYQSYANATSYTWTKDTTGPTITFTSPAPSSFINAAVQSSFNIAGTCTDSGQMVNLTVVGGSSSSVVCTGGAWNANVNTTGVSDGTVTVNVNMADALGNPATQISRDFTKDTLAPTTSSLLINAGASSTANQVVSLDISSTGASHMYVTNTAGCSAGGTWEAYSITKSGWNLAGTNSNQTVYIKFKDAAGNESSCINDTITHAGPAIITITDGPTYDYGQVAVGGSVNHTFTLTNTGAQSATSISEAGLAAPFQFAGGTYPGTGGTCGGSISSGSTCTIAVSFAPSMPGVTNDSIQINYNDGVAAASVSRDLIGTGANPAFLTISDGSVFHYGNVAVGNFHEHIFTINNTGGMPATGLGSGGPLVSPFNFKSTSTFPGATGTCGSSLAAGSSCTVVVTFAPGSVSSNLNESIDINYNDGAAAASVSRSISGNGVNPFSLMALGLNTTCGRDTTGDIYCWGENQFGQFGNGNTVNSLQRTPSSVYDFTALASFENTTCGVDVTNQGYCWGRNNNGQVGNGNMTDVSTPHLLSGSWVKIVPGKTHTCGIQMSGYVQCWGQNSYGQLGNNSTTDSSSPVSLYINDQYADIDVGEQFTCGILTNGTVKCWGLGDTGQMGNGTTTVTNNQPTTTSSITGASSITLGARHACVLYSGNMKCWGSSDSGQIGNGGTSSQLTPTVISDNQWQKISAGAEFTCGTKTGDQLFCWGRGAEGQLGTYGNSQTNSPAYVGNFSDVFSGFRHACALSPMGGVHCWGQNTEGQLGNNTTAAANFPLPVFP